MMTEYMRHRGVRTAKEFGLLDRLPTIGHAPGFPRPGPLRLDPCPLDFGTPENDRIAHDFLRDGVYAGERKVWCVVVQQEAYVDPATQEGDAFIIAHTVFPIRVMETGKAAVIRYQCVVVRRRFLRNQDTCLEGVLCEVDDGRLSAWIGGDPERAQA